MLFEEAYNNYLIYAQKRHKKQGFDTIFKNLNLHILPYFKGTNICELTKTDILDWQNKILDKNFSNNFNRNLYYEFSAFFNYCVNYCNIKENIVLQCEKFKKKIEKDKSDFYNLFEFLRFYFNLDGEKYKIYFWLMFFYGFRPGEAMALRLSDLGFFRLNVNHGLQRKGKRELDLPKNQSSIRSLNIGLITYIKLCKLRKHYIKKYGYGVDYFICGGSKPLAPTSIDRYKERACNKARIRVITQHQFRHSYATRKIHERVPVDYVSSNLGHSKVSTTVDVYLHQKKRNVRSIPNPWF